MVYNFVPMKSFVFAVLLFAVQAAPLIPRKSIDSLAHVVKVQGETPPNQTRALPATASIQADNSGPSKSDSGQQGIGNMNHTIGISKLPSVTVERDWADWGYWGFSLLLVAVGALQVLLLCWTLRAVRVQATEMRRQRVHIGNQLQTMKGQLDEMSKQTKFLDEYVNHTKVTAEAAKNSAEAALQNAHAVINAERPWIVASLIRSPRTSYSIGGNQHLLPSVSFTLCFRNYGRTLAHVISVRTCPRVVKSIDDLPARPEYLDELPASFQSALMIVPRGNWKYDCTDVSTIVMPQQWEDIQIGKQLFVYFGRIEYRDVFRPDVLHETRFSYAYRFRIDDLVIEGPREYTKYT